MDTRSGELFTEEEVRRAKKFQESLDEAERKHFFESLIPLERDHRLHDAINTQNLAMVSGQVAQQVRLGQRELDRRRRRRRAAKQGRKRNR